MTLHGERQGGHPDFALVQRLLLLWRARCGAAAAPWELTAGRSAMNLCIEVVRTLESGIPSPDLAEVFRAWGAAVPSPVEARAALQCLSEAVIELVSCEYGPFRPRGLDPVLARAAGESVVPGGRRTVPAAVDTLSRSPDRETLEHDLIAAVAAAAGAGDDLTVAVFELDGANGPEGEPRPVDVDQLLELRDTIRRTCGSQLPTYRVGSGTFALLVRKTGSRAAGDLILRATCSAGPRFFWGRASLRAGGRAASASPEMLLLLAEADLYLRRQDIIDTRRTVARHRQLSVVGSVAAGLLLVGAVGAGLAGAPGGPSNRAALRPHVPAQVAPATTTPPAVDVPGPPASAAPAESAAPVAPPAGSLAGAATPAPPGPAPAPAASAVLASYQAPPPSPQPPAPPSQSPGPTTAPGPQHGHSGSAPGHLKGAAKITRV